MADVLKTARIRPAVTPPAGVEATIREGKGKRLMFLINHMEDEKRVNVPPGRKELITGKTTEVTLTLGAYDVAVIRL